MKFPIFSIVEHSKFGQGIVKMYSCCGITASYTVLFGNQNQFTRNVKEHELFVPVFKKIAQTELPQFL